MWAVIFIWTGLFMSEAICDVQGPTTRAIDTQGFPLSKGGWHPMPGLVDQFGPQQRPSHRLISVAHVDSANKAHLQQIAHHNAQILRQYNHKAPITQYHNPFPMFKSPHVGLVLKAGLNNAHKHIHGGVTVPKVAGHNVVSSGTKNLLSYQQPGTTNTYLSFQKKEILTPPPPQKPKQVHPVLGKLQAHMALARRAKPYGTNLKTQQTAPSNLAETFAPIPFLGYGALLGREKIPQVSFTEDFSQYLVKDIQNPFRTRHEFHQYPTQNEVLPNFALSDEFTKHLVPPPVYRHQDSSQFRGPKPTPSTQEPETHSAFIPSPTDTSITEEQTDILSKYNIGKLPLQDNSKFSYNPATKQTVQEFASTTEGPVLPESLLVQLPPPFPSLSSQHIFDGQNFHLNLERYKSANVHYNGHSPPPEAYTENIETNIYSTSSKPLSYSPNYLNTQRPTVVSFNGDIFTNNNGNRPVDAYGKDQKTHFFKTESQFFGSDALKPFAPTFSPDLEPGINGNSDENYKLQPPRSVSTPRPIDQSGYSVSEPNWYDGATFTTTKPNLFKHLERPSSSDYKQHKVMHPAFTGARRPPVVMVPSNYEENKPFLPTPYSPLEYTTALNHNDNSFNHADNSLSTPSSATKRRPTKDEDSYLANLFTKIRENENTTPMLVEYTHSNHNRHHSRMPQVQSTYTESPQDSNELLHDEQTTPNPRTRNKNRRRRPKPTPETLAEYETSTKSNERHRVVYTTTIPPRTRTRLPVNVSRTRTTAPSTPVELTSSAKPTVAPTSSVRTRRPSETFVQNNNDKVKSSEWNLAEQNSDKILTATEYVETEQRPERPTMESLDEIITEDPRNDKNTNTKQNPDTTTDIDIQTIYKEETTTEERRTTTRTRPKVELGTDASAENVKPDTTLSAIPDVSKRNRLRFKERVQEDASSTTTIPTPLPEINEITTVPSTTSTTTVPPTTTLKSHRIRQRVKIENRPRFSVKDYRQRLNQYTSTTPTPDDHSANYRPRQPTRNRFDAGEPVQEEPAPTVDIPRRRFKPKDPRHRYTQDGGYKERSRVTSDERNDRVRTSTTSATLHRIDPDLYKRHRVSPESSERHRGTPESTERHRETPESTDQHRGSAESTDRHRVPPKFTERHRGIPESTERHRGTPESLESDPDTPESTERNLGTPESIKRHRGTPESTKQDRETPESTERHRGTPKSTERHRGTPESIESDPDTPKYTERLRGTPESIESDPDTPKSTERLRGTPESIKRHRGTPESIKQHREIPESTEQHRKTADSVERQQITTQENELEITKAPGRRVIPRKDFSTRTRSTTETSAIIEPPTRAFRNHSLSLRRPYPSLRTRIQTKMKLDQQANSPSTSTEDPMKNEPLEITTLIETPLIPDSRFEVTPASSKSETAIMKIGKITLQPEDLVTSPSEQSQRVAELTSSAHGDYNNPTLFRSVPTASRKVPGYFTLATDDPILPIEAFFPQFAQKNKKDKWRN